MNVFMFRKVMLAVIIFLAIGMGANPIQAQDVQAGSKTDAPVAEKQDAKPQAEISTSASDDVQQLLKRMQAQLDAQNKQIQKLQSHYSTEVDARQKEFDKQNKQISEQAKQIVTQKEAIQSLQQQVDQTVAMAGQDISDSEKALRSRLETVETSIKASEEADSTTYDLDSFPGSLPIPGSSAAIRFGGFVKMNLVESFDPIGTTDRFIVGSIPVPQTSGAANTALTVSQSRMNIDMRDTTQYGALRAFIEGDFAGAGDTFRLRHAFGQYKSFLVGKNWTTFMDTRSRPEDLDFEGINGQILLRQPQVRYFPKIGKDWHFLLSAEDPSTTIIDGGTGVSKMPDLIASIERTFFDRWHVKSSLLIRSMEGECDCNPDKAVSAGGWALSVSGMAGLTRWDARDNMQIQLSYGEGFSHYVNDLGSIGGADAIFDPLTGKLHAIPVFAGYIALQKWWSPTMRSNLNYGYVSVKNNLVFGPAIYKNTHRFTINYIWSPIARIDLGAQFLTGSRSNDNGESARASQIQLSAKYRY